MNNIKFIDILSLLKIKDNVCICLDNDDNTFLCSPLYTVNDIINNQYIIKIKLNNEEKEIDMLNKIVQSINVDVNTFFITSLHYKIHFKKEDIL